MPAANWKRICRSGPRTRQSERWLKRLMVHNLRRLPKETALDMVSFAVIRSLPFFRCRLRLNRVTGCASLASRRKNPCRGRGNLASGVKQLRHDGDGAYAHMDWLAGGA